MEENKLTNEEIIKALECCAEDGPCLWENKCPLRNDKNCHVTLSGEALGVIHRLQGEIADYERKFEEGELVSKEWHDEQVGHAELVMEEQKAEIEKLLCKNAELEVRCEWVLKDYYAECQTCDEQRAEIERLTEERERVAWQKQEYLDWVHGLLSTHTEMKNRGEDYKMFDRDWLCDILWLKIEPFYATIFDLERQRNELQKQVDELKKRLVDEFEAFKFEAYGKVKQQAVKNAVEETVQHFWEKFAGNCEMWISDEIERYAKEKGVEVE